MIPAISIGTSMAFSVVGYDFYVGQRNLDGTDVGENAITDAEAEPTTDSNSPNGTKFTQDEATWFGMSGCIWVLQSSKGVTCATKMCPYNKITLSVHLENEMLL